MSHSPGADPAGNTPTPPASSARPQSVRLREQTGERADQGTLLDPANQSLADALRITYRLLQIAMVLLLGMFLLSGFQTVQANERGVRLMFGKPVADNLEPGFQFSFPYPVGELLRVDAGATTVALDDSFYPRIAETQRQLGLEALASSAAKSRLVPGTDGTVITGDQSIAHTRWKVVYRRGAGEKGSVADFEQNILREHEQAIVWSSIERGVVQAIAEVGIDVVLKQSATEGASVTARAREIAQAALDRLNAGLYIEQLTMQDKSPPFYLYSDFAKVQSAQQDSSSAREKAEAQARQTLNNAAGAAALPLIAQINQYEAAVERKDRAAADSALARINALMEGQPVTIDGQVVQAPPAGEVTSILASAREHRTSVVGRRRAELDAFKAKLAQYRSNPRLVIDREWQEAYDAFTRSRTMEQFYLPRGVGQIDLTIQRDPAYARAIEKEINERNAREGQAKREAERSKREFQTDTERRTVQE